MDSPKMTAEQLQALRNQMMSGQSQPTQQAAPSPQPAPQPMQQPMQQSAQRPSAQDAMRARMQASRGQSSTQPVMMEQGSLTTLHLHSRFSSLRLYRQRERLIQSSLQIRMLRLTRPS